MAKENGTEDLAKQISAVADCVLISTNTKKLLADNPEWVDRYSKYAEQILNNAETIKSNKKLFHEFSPLFLYMNVSNAKGQGIFGLRYAGQQVADLKVVDGKVLVNTKAYDEINKRDFACEIKLINALWNSADVSKFRKHFLQTPTRSEESKKHNEEHRLESALLTEFSKTKSTDKLILDIQPCCLFGGISRFQMPTPLTASGNDVKYSGASGGGIDILCRVGSGANTKLCVVEVKDENKPSEPPQKAIGQAVAYATFLHELLKSKSGDKWYEIFGFSRSVPDKLKIVASVAMPYNEQLTSNFDGAEISFDDNDKLILQSMFLTETDKQITKIKSSFEKVAKGYENLPNNSVNGWGANADGNDKYYFVNDKFYCVTQATMTKDIVQYFYNGKKWEKLFKDSYPEMLALAKALINGATEITNAELTAKEIPPCTCKNGRMLNTAQMEDEKNFSKFNARLEQGGYKFVAREKKEKEQAIKNYILDVLAKTNGKCKKKFAKQIWEQLKEATIITNVIFDLIPILKGAKKITLNKKKIKEFTNTKDLKWVDKMKNADGILAFFGYDKAVTDFFKMRSSTNTIFYVDMTPKKKVKIFAIEK